MTTIDMSKHNSTQHNGGIYFFLPEEEMYIAINDIDHTEQGPVVPDNATRYRITRNGIYTDTPSGWQPA